VLALGDALDDLVVLFQRFPAAQFQKEFRGRGALAAPENERQAGDQDRGG
jgi:hypothetical protein